MDASALLAKQGWRGAGHGLGSTGHGISRPLLISNKQDALGIGKKKLQVADQWWMRAYDTGLKELGTGKQTALSSIRQNGMNRGGLYGFFVRGEGLAGTISDASDPLSSSTSSPSDSSTPATTPEAESTPEPSEKKRKRAEGEEGKRKKRKEGSVTQSKGKSKKGRRSKQDSADEAATEDPKLLRRAAKKALRQQRALRSNQASEDEKKNEGSETPASEASKGKEKRKREGKGTDSQREKVSEKKLKKYAAKAAEKGMTTEAFLAKRERKREKAKK